MSIFEKIIYLKLDREAVYKQVNAQKNNINALIITINDRITEDHKRSEERIAELKRLMQDPAKTETILKIYAAEIKKLETSSFVPTDTEKEMLELELLEYEKTARDFGKVDKDLRDALGEARAELESIRETINKNAQPFNVFSWVEAEKKRVAKLINSL